MAKRFLSDLPKFEGPFSCDRDTLIANISTFNKDYSANDPWTWPFITDEAIRKVCGKEYDGGMELPVAVAAYSSETVHKYKSIRIYDPYTYINKTEGEPVRMKTLFYHFPYHYSSQGIPRAHQYLTDAARRGYISDVSKESEEVNQFLAPKPKPKEREKAKVSMQRPTKAHLESPDMVYKEVLRMVACHGKANAEDMDAVKRELSHAMQLLAEEKAKTKDAELKRKDLRKMVLKKCGQLDEAHIQTTKAEQKIQELKVQLQERDSELASTRTEATEANERMRNVWSEMKKTKESDLRKRKNEVGSNAKHGPIILKKARTDDQV